MITTLNILIDLALIVAVFSTYRTRSRETFYTQKIYHLPKRALGRIEQVARRAAIAEKMGERAFNLASSATIGVVALQKSLATPRLLTKTQVTQNLLAKTEIDRLFTKDGDMEWLKPVLSDEELDILEKAEEHQAKFGQGN